MKDKKTHRVILSDAKPGIHNLKVSGWGHLRPMLRKAFQMDKIHKPYTVRVKRQGESVRAHFRKMKPSHDNAGNSLRVQVNYYGLDTDVGETVTNITPIQAKLSVRSDYPAPMIHRTQKAPCWVDLRHVDRKHPTIGSFAQTIRMYVHFPSWLLLNFSQGDAYLDLPLSIEKVKAHIVVPRYYKRSTGCLEAKGVAYQTSKGLEIRIYVRDVQHELDADGEPLKVTRIECAIRTRRMRKVVQLPKGPTKVHHLQLLLEQDVNLFGELRWFRFRPGPCRERKWRDEFERHRRLVAGHKMEMQEVYNFIRVHGIKLESWLQEDTSFSTVLWQRFRPYLKEFLSDLQSAEDQYELAHQKWQAKYGNGTKPKLDTA